MIPTRLPSQSVMNANRPTPAIPNGGSVTAPLHTGVPRITGPDPEEIRWPRRLETPAEHHLVEPTCARDIIRADRKMSETGHGILPRNPSMTHDRNGAARILLVLAHPSYERSRANRSLCESAGTPDGVTLHDLYETYPDFMIDVRREQALLVAHDIIMLQFPFYWYSMPALLKEWFDLVWLYGFAYGHDGSRLAGKTLFCVITTGGEAASYAPDGQHGHTTAEFLRPLERTAHLCGMLWEPPLIVHADALDNAPGAYLARLETLLALLAT